MNGATRGRTRAVLAMLALVALLAGWDGLGWWRERQWNERIAATATQPAAALAGDAAAQPPELSFAQAFRLERLELADAALKRYRALQGDGALGQRARYNSANLMLQQAQQIRASAEPGQAIALIELAKEIYREVLRIDPGFWDARYNLERAQRLLPDPDDDGDAPAGAPSAAERAATTMRGYSPGLP